jgi:mRNA interferase MazF
VDRLTVTAPWQVWWAELDPTVGNEQAGRRPVLVVSSPFHLALTAQALVTVLPITSRHRPTWAHRVPVQFNGRTSYVITEQVRTVAQSRLVGAAITQLTPAEVNAVRVVLGQMFA